MPYRPPQKKKKKPNGLFPTGGNWTVKSCEVYQDDGDDDDGTTKKNEFFKNFMNDDDDDGTTKTVQFSQCFVNGKKVESSQFPHDGTAKTAQFSQSFMNGKKFEDSEFQQDFEKFMHSNFDDNDNATGVVNKKNVQRSYMQMELVHEPEPKSCCAIL